MKFLTLPRLSHGRAAYSSDDVIRFVGDEERANPERATSLIEIESLISISNFQEHGIIIAKSSFFGEIVAFKLSGDCLRRIEHSRFFSPGMKVAVKEARDEKDYEDKLAIRNRKRLATIAEKRMRKAVELAKT